MPPIAALRLSQRILVTEPSRVPQQPAAPSLKVPPLPPAQPSTRSPAPSPPPPTQRSASADLRLFGVVDPQPAIPAELTRAMVQASAKSPTLKAMLVGTLRAGYPFILGTAGNGTYTDVNTTPKTIVVDPSQLGDPALLAQSLAHELGHVYQNDYPHVFDPRWDRTRYVSENTVRALSGEADACMMELRVRDEVIARGGTPPPISGKGDAKIALWARHVAGEAGLASDDEIRRALALFIGKNEHPSTDPTQTYWDYYAASFADGWDARNTPGQHLGIPPPPP